MKTTKTKAELSIAIEELQGQLKEAEEKLVAYQKNETGSLPAQKLEQLQVEIAKQDRVSGDHCLKDKSISSLPQDYSQR